jgi:hypothetical protein
MKNKFKVTICSDFSIWPRPLPLPLGGGGGRLIAGIIDLSFWSNRRLFKSWRRSVFSFILSSTFFCNSFDDLFVSPLEAAVSLDGGGGGGGLRKLSAILQISIEFVKRSPIKILKK